MRDDRVRQLATADEIARAKKRVIFVFRSDGAIAIYILGRRIWASKAWNAN